MIEYEVGDVLTLWENPDVWWRIMEVRRLPVLQDAPMYLYQASHNGTKHCAGADYIDRWTFKIGKASEEAWAAMMFAVRVEGLERVR